MKNKKLLYFIIGSLSFVFVIFFYIFLVPTVVVAPSIRFDFTAPFNPPDDENTEIISPVALREIKIGEKVIFVMEAATDKEQNTGLSKETSLNDDSGMLFVFKESTQAFFWMKGVKFSLDIIWIKDNKVIGFEQNLPTELDVPDSQLKIYSSPGKVDYVLEVNADFIEKNNVKIGDEINL